MKINIKRKSEELTCNDFVNVRDIHDNLIWSKNQYIISFLKLYPVNIDLMSKTDKEKLCSDLTAEFKGEQNKFAIWCHPRNLDMEEYVTYLQEKLDQEIMNVKRKILLEIMIEEAAKKIMTSSNYEHQFFIQLWEKIDVGKNENQKKKHLAERILEFQRRYEQVGNLTKQLDDTELLKLCNMFSNSSTALFDYVDEYIPIPWIKKEEGKEYESK